MAVTTTASPLFAQTVTALIKAELINLLRTGLPHMPREVMVISSYQQGTGDGTGDALFRHISYKDLPPNTTDLVEGVTPAGQELQSEVLEFKASQKGDYVRVSDVFSMQSPADIPSIMVERVTRQAAITFDAIAKGIWHAHPAGEVVLGVNTATIKESDIRAAVAILASRNVPKIGTVGASTANDAAKSAGDLGRAAGGSYIGLAHPFVISDLMATAEWVDTSKYAAPHQLLTGEIGMYRGVRFIQASTAKISGTGAATIYRTIIAGAQALAWADPALLQTFMAGFTPSESDPLAQRAAAGWKGWAGGSLVGMGGSFRHVVVESTSSLSANLVAQPYAVGGQDYAGLNVAELQAEASERGLPMSGTKAELIERLTAEEG